MVTGSPGAGKTLSVSSILRSRKETKINLNANTTKNIREVNEQICSTLLKRTDGMDLTAFQIIRELQK